MGRARGKRGHAAALGAMVAATLFVGRPCVFALNPALDVNQYAHTPWKIREGFSKGTIVSIAQTHDGYLWLGSEFGLLRFDGARRIVWQPPDGQQLPSNYIRSLLAARDGTLWIGTNFGLTSWKDGKLTLHGELGRQSIWTLLEDREGTVWAGGHHAAPAARLCAFRGSSVQCYGEDGGFGQHIECLYEDRAGSLWVSGVTGLWRWKPGPPKLYPMPDRALGLVDGDTGEILIATSAGIKRLVNGKLDAYPLPVNEERFSARSLLRDRDGALWVGTADRGLVHLHQGRMDVYDRSAGLSSDFIEGIFEDREGSIWAPTLDGVDRFHEIAAPTVSLKQGLSNATVKSVLAARDGSVWLGTNDGINRWNNGRVTVYRSAGGVSGLPDDFIESFFQDDRDRIWIASRRGLAFFQDGHFTSVRSVPGEIHGIDGDGAGNVWLCQEEKLYHLRDGRVVEQIPWYELGRSDFARGVIVDRAGGGLWLAFRDSGVSYFKDGKITHKYSVNDGLGWGTTREFQLGGDGALWVSTEAGLSRLKDGYIATLNKKNGLPCDPVNWVTVDDSDFYWLHMGCGMVRIAGSEMKVWAREANKDAGPQVHATVFDGSDGVRTHLNSTGYSPSVAKTADGKLWFLPWDGVSVIDPHHLPFNQLPPAVRIEQITANHTAYDEIALAKGDLHLPARIRDLEIEYTALSLVAAEKVQFRYKLEGYDSEWQDVGTRRQAYYGNLPPRSYRFLVRACNNSGVWNEAGAFLDFDIAPAYYQSTWFRVSCAAAVLAVLGALYQLRLRQMRRQFNIRLEERVAERTRIARDFHDTLLQSFQGVLLKLAAVAYGISDNESQEKLEGVIAQARQAMAEGRDAVQGLRSSTVMTNDLARTIGAIGEELAHDPANGNNPEFRMQVQGESRDLPPLVRDEVYRLACEALRNAFRHARARRIEVGLRYDPRQLRLLVRDDGRGIDARVLDAGGAAGHYGLPGMRERARLAGGELVVRSHLDSGTEVELTIPASLAYSKSPGAPNHQH
jgi:signal transduction histidine kinase/ligand-binding sensor domain-containing protein